MLSTRINKALTSSAYTTYFSRSFSGFTPSAETYNVPEGHKESDLSRLACNIGLMINRDLTLRQDLRLHQTNKEVPLTDIFKGYKALVLGLPDCGEVCKEQHVASYLKSFDELKNQGVNKILAISVGSPDKLETFGKNSGASSDKIEFWADPQGAFTRMMGLELNAPESSSGPWSQRYVALVTNGKLIKVNIDKSPAECKESHADAVLELVKKY
eukprot:TRINITY_DN707_c0_g1_i4.p3 TRINITY_DN707_c0_g1~~TRINITY_DN707_c0_g1_i4.p3  ORF type:complete len:214 (-),score=20.63 TRINITY_DN707_c0_g1_i4:163-804(-)